MVATLRIVLLDVRVSLGIVVVETRIRLRRLAQMAPAAEKRDRHVWAANSATVVPLRGGVAATLHIATQDVRMDSGSAHPHPHLPTRQP